MTIKNLGNNNKVIETAGGGGSCLAVHNDNACIALSTAVTKLDFMEGLTASEPVANEINVTLDIVGLSQCCSPACGDFLIIHDITGCGSLKKLPLSQFPGGGCGANKFLSNLTSPTAINQPLILPCGNTVRFVETGCGCNYIELLAPAALAVNVTLTLPTDNGTCGQVLTTNGCGVLSFACGGISSVGCTTVNRFAVWAGCCTDTLRQPNATVRIAQDFEIDSGRDLRFIESGVGCNYVAFQAPSCIAIDVTLTLPNNDGCCGQVLTTDGGGILSWSAIPCSGVARTGCVTDNYLAVWDGTGASCMIQQPNAVVIVNQDLSLICGRDLRFNESGCGTEYVAFQAPASITCSVTWTLPSIDGACNQVLTTNGVGVLSWTNAACGLTRVGASTSNEIVVWCGCSTCMVKSPTTTVTVDQTLSMVGTGIRFKETGAGCEYVEVLAPAALAANYTLTLPIDNGTCGQLLSTNGCGVLAWATPPVTRCGTTCDNELAIWNGSCTNSLQASTTNTPMIAREHITFTAAKGLRLTNGWSGCCTNYVEIKASTSGPSIANYVINLPLLAPTVSGSVLVTSGSNTEWKKRVGLCGCVSVGSNELIRGGSTCGTIAHTGNTYLTNRILQVRCCGSIQFKENGCVGSSTIAIKAPTCIAANFTLTLPVDNGTPCQLLQTNGCGVLSWACASPGTVAGTGTDNYLVAWDGTCNIHDPDADILFSQILRPVTTNATDIGTQTITIKDIYTEKVKIGQNANSKLWLETFASGCLFTLPSGNTVHSTIALNNTGAHLGIYTPTHASGTTGDIYIDTGNNCGSSIGCTGDIAIQTGSTTHACLFNKNTGCIIISTGDNAGTISTDCPHTGHIKLSTGCITTNTSGYGKGYIQIHDTKYYKATVQTTNACVTELITINTESDMVYYVDAKIIGRRTHACDEYASYHIKTRFNTNGCTLAQGCEVCTFTSESNASYNATVAADTNDIDFDVTGVACHTVCWTINVAITEG